MPGFREFLERYTYVPENDWNVIESYFEKIEFKKNDIILEIGNICKYFYFLETGLIRFFVVNDGDDITKFFTTSPYCFTSKDSFRNQKISEEGIEALDDCVAFRISLNNANKLLELNSWSEFTRKFLHEVQTHTEDLLINIKTKTAEQRYAMLLSTYPTILPKIPLKHLSTFLGIAPQSLSRIRKKNNL